MKLKHVTAETLLATISHIPSWMTDDEKLELFQLGQAVPAGGRIIEIGALYGGSTAILGLASRGEADLFVVDNFSWSPLADTPASQDQLRANLKTVGLTKITVAEMDSRTCIYNSDAPKIDLLWIDGGHSFEFIYHDLSTFGPYAQVIACHDYDNPAWPTIRQAVEQFISEHPEWRVDHVVGQVVVLCK